MFQVLHDRRSVALLTALFLVCFILMSMSARQRGETTVFEELVLTISGPLVEAATAPKRWTQNIWDHYIALRGFQQKNKRIMKELASLRYTSVRIQELESQVARLEGLLGSVQGKKVQVRLAKIIGRPQSPFGKLFIINQGEINGVRRNMPVIHQWGIVGRVFRVGRSVSQVLPIINSRSSVDIIVLRTRAQGVFSISPENLGEVRYMPAEANITQGDLLISSGLGGIFPKGFPVARVDSTRKGGNHLFQTVKASPTVDFSKIEEILIMLVHQKETP